MIYLLLAIFFILWGLFIYSIIKKDRLKGFYYKGFTSFSFVLVFAYGVYEYIILDNGVQPLLLELKYSRLFIFIGIGLVSGVIGDLFLELQYFYKERKFYQITKGMIIFLIGHIFYILAMSFFVGFNYISLIIGAIMTGVVFFGSKIMKIDFKELKWMTYIYSFVIFTMVGLAITQAFELSFSLYSVSFLIGGILFGISDLVLAPIYFKEQKNNLFTIINLSTYYSAQLLIALSIIFL